MSKRKTTVPPRPELSGIAPEVCLPVEGADMDKTLDEVEKSLLRQALAEMDGNKTKAAYHLNIQRTTLIEKLRKFGMLERG